jgi:sigma-B regulation protein RsbU (phosphoserine phosphatase)
MSQVTDTFLRDQLLTRREKLASAINTAQGAEGLVELLREVDSALARMEAGGYGLCEACQEPIERGRLLADPLVRYCLDHLRPEERRALENDLELASQVQRKLLPRQDWSFDGWEASYHYQPKGMVSGDYCDIIAREEGPRGLFFLLGDVSGKGVAASILMAQLHAIFHTLLGAGLPLSDMLARAGRIFCESTLCPFFATLVCGRAHATGEIELSNAGHCPVLLARREHVTRLEATGVPLGMFCTSAYPAQTIQLSAGDTLLLYTDGVSEARAASGEEFGEQRLVSLLAKHHTTAPRGLLEACLDDLQAFRCGAPLADDLTVMAIRRVGQSGCENLAEPAKSL